MSELLWNEAGDKFYETGIDKGVLYLNDGTGVPWNGLISVDEKSLTKTQSYYFDGKKFIDFPILSDFEGSVSAYSYPDEFFEYEGLGTNDDVQGMYLAGQYQKTFGLSYRTLVGNDVDGISHGYKIHVLYNLTAEAENINRETMNDNIDPIEFQWTVNSRPEVVTGFRPTAHIIFDSRTIDPDAFVLIEAALYGSTDGDSHLPSLSEFVTFLTAFGLITITDNEDGTWTASGPDEFVYMIDGDIFEIIGVLPEFLTETTYRLTTTS